MTTEEQYRIARALRRAASRIERGDLSVSHGVMEWMTLDYDGIESHDTPDDAQRHASVMIEPQECEYHPDVDQVSWGVYVAIEAARIDSMPPDYDYGSGTAAEHGYDSWWEVSMCEAWTQEDGR